MKKVMIIALILFVALFIPAVSAETIIDEEFTSYEYTGGTYNTPADVNNNFGDVNKITFTNIQNRPDLSYIGFTVPSGYVSNVPDDGVHDFTYMGLGETKTGRFHIESSRNLLGGITSYRYIVFFDDWDIGDSVGSKTITLSTPFFHGMVTPTPVYAKNGVADLTDGGGRWFAGGYPISIVSSKTFKNHLTVNDDYPNSYQINLQRIYGSQYYPSTINLKQNDTTVFSDGSADDFTTIYLKSDINKIEVTAGDFVYISSLTVEGIDDPGTNTAAVAVYVRNSQTGALLANAHLTISANVDGDFYEVVNRTVPSGIYSIDLQPTGGGDPNPDYYRLWVTLDGYNSQMPYIDFEVSGGTTVYVYLEPTEEPPADENMTFVEFYVRDLNANPLANAEVNCGGYTLKTNSAGYTQFEVAKNASYPYSVTKTGYLTIEGIATVESDDRYTVNVALMAGVVPTHTAVTPTITVEPTPTQTIPPIQEDNLIGLSVKGLAKGFGIDYDTALLLFGLMIVFGAGGIVMSSVKGGAMEFIAGSIVGTFVAFALGLIPIWIFIIIAVVFGAYVLRVFIQGGQ